MQRLLLIGFAASAFVLAPALSATAMPIVSPDTLSISEGTAVQVKGGRGGGRGSMGRGGRGKSYGFSRGRGRGGCPPGLRMQGRC